MAKPELCSEETETHGKTRYLAEDQPSSEPPVFASTKGYFPPLCPFLPLGKKLMLEKGDTPAVKDITGTRQSWP